MLTHAGPRQAPCTLRRAVGSRIPREPAGRCRLRRVRMHRDGVPRVDLDALGAARQSIHNAYAGRLREHAQQLPHRMRDLHDGPHRPFCRPSQRACVSRPAASAISRGTRNCEGPYGTGTCLRRRDCVEQLVKVDFVPDLTRDRNPVRSRPHRALAKPNCGTTRR